MPFFSRRRLAQMLDELGPYLSAKRSLDFVNRIEGTRTSTTLAAEVEMAFLWAMSKAVDLEVEPSFPNTSSRVDAFSRNFLRSGPCVVEIRAVSDDTFSGENDMNRIAHKIVELANKARKGTGNHLYFQFREESYYRDGKFYRERLADPKFEISSEVRSALQHWLTNGEDAPQPKTVHLELDRTSVQITFRETPVHPKSRVFCTMPNVAYDYEKNPVFKALKAKSAQFSGIDRKYTRVVVLFDVGCRLLRNLRPYSTFSEISGERIILHAIRRLNVDAVVVLSPQYKTEVGTMLWGADRSKHWNVSILEDERECSDAEYDRLKEAIAYLPRPAFEGYQARSIHEQGLLKPEGNFGVLPGHITTWSGPHVSNNEGIRMRVKVSARALQQYLAGLLSKAEFESLVFGSHRNEFVAATFNMDSIRNVSFESGGLDEDDDLVVFDLGFDPGAAPLGQRSE